MIELHSKVICTKCKTEKDGNVYMRGTLHVRYLDLDLPKGFHQFKDFQFCSKCYRDELMNELKSLDT